MLHSYPVLKTKCSIQLHVLEIVMMIECYNSTNLQAWPSLCTVSD